MLVEVTHHVLCRQLIPKLSQRSAQCSPFSTFRIGIFYNCASFPVVNWGGHMNPVRRMLRIRFASLHANAQRDLFAFVGTGLDYVWKSNHFSMRAIGQVCFIT